MAHLKRRWKAQIAAPQSPVHRATSFGATASGHIRHPAMTSGRFSWARGISALGDSHAHQSPWHLPLAPQLGRFKAEAAEAAAQITGNVLWANLRCQQTTQAIFNFTNPMALSVDTLFGEERDYTDKRPQTSPNRACVFVCVRVKE